MKFNIDKFLAEEVINSSLQTGLLHLNSNGFAEYNDKNKTIVENGCKDSSEEKTSQSNYNIAHSDIINFPNEENIDPNHCKAEELGM